MLLLIQIAENHLKYFKSLSFLQSTGNGYFPLHPPHRKLIDHFFVSVTGFLCTLLTLENFANNVVTQNIYNKDTCV